MGFGPYEWLKRSRLRSVENTVGAEWLRGFLGARLGDKADNRLCSTGMFNTNCFLLVGTFFSTFTDYSPWYEGNVLSRSSGNDNVPRQLEEHVLVVYNEPRRLNVVSLISEFCNLRAGCNFDRFISVTMDGRDDMPRTSSAFLVEIFVRGNSMLQHRSSRSKVNLIGNKYSIGAEADLSLSGIGLVGNSGVDSIGSGRLKSNSVLIICDIMQQTVLITDWLTREVTYYCLVGKFGRSYDILDPVNKGCFSLYRAVFDNLELRAIPFKGGGNDANPFSVFLNKRSRMGVLNLTTRKEVYIEADFYCRGVMAWLGTSLVPFDHFVRWARLKIHRIGCTYWLVRFAGFKYSRVGVGYERASNVVYWFLKIYKDVGMAWVEDRMIMDQDFTFSKLAASQQSWLRRITYKTNELHTFCPHVATHNLYGCVAVLARPAKGF